MLAEIGAASIDDLFAVIPAELRLTGDLDVPRAHAESEIIETFRAAGQENATTTPAFSAQVLIATTAPSSLTHWSSAASFSRVIRPIRQR